jgi:tetratricopeptide (TPR) repeat protein
LKVQPDNVEAQNNLAWLWATAPDAALRKGVEAVALAEQANRLSGGQNPAVLCTLAAAYAEVGRFPDAVNTAQKALQLAESQTNAAPVVNALQTQIKCYQAGSPFRDRSLTNMNP